MTTEITVVKCFEECADITEQKDDHKKFYERFGKFLKLAIHENSTSQTKIPELVRFRYSKRGDELNRLKEHVERREGVAQ